MTEEVRPVKKVECDCIQRLDKLRMDIEAGKDVAFVVVLFDRGDESKGIEGRYDSIMHDVSLSDLAIGVIELAAKALKMREE